MLPVGQPFWIELRYFAEQTDPTKTLSVSWAGTQIDVPIKLERPLINLYLGGPFVVQPPL
jgi:hypothetical protein